MYAFLVVASLVLAVACAPTARCGPASGSAERISERSASSTGEPCANATGSANQSPVASAPTPAPTSAGTPAQDSNQEWPAFVCEGHLNRTLTTAAGFEPNIVLRREEGQIEIDGIVDGGLRAAMQIVQSYRMNATRYFVATTPPGLTKIHYSFFLYVNNEKRGTLELRSLSGSLRIGYYDLVCKHVEPKPADVSN